MFSFGSLLVVIVGPAYSSWEIFLTLFVWDKCYMYRLFHPKSCRE